MNESRMNESCHIWMSHVTDEWVMSHIWMSHVTYEWVTSHMNESCHMWMSPVTYEWVMSHMNEACHIWMSHVTYECVMSHVNESRHTRSHVTLWVMSHIWRVLEALVDQRMWMSHVTHIIESCTCEWVMSHTKESCHTISHVTYEWVMSHMNESCHTMRHVTHMKSFRGFGRHAHVNESCHTHNWVISHTNESCPIWVSHVTQWVMSHIWRVFEALADGRKETKGKIKTGRWVISHIEMSHISHTDGLCLT